MSRRSKESLRVKLLKQNFWLKYAANYPNSNIHRLAHSLGDRRMIRFLRKQQVALSPVNRTRRRLVRRKNWIQFGIEATEDFMMNSVRPERAEPTTNNFIPKCLKSVFSKFVEIFFPSTTTGSLQINDHSPTLV